IGRFIRDRSLTRAAVALLAERAPAGSLDDREHRRVPEPALDRDGVEARAHFREAPDALERGRAEHVVLDGARDGEEPEAVRAEGLEQRAVVELALDAWAQAVLVEELLEPAAQGRALGRQEHRRAVERAREALAVARGELARRAEGHSALAERVVE